MGVVVIGSTGEKYPHGPLGSFQATFVGFWIVHCEGGYCISWHTRVGVY